jgi:hypothetical protein
MGQVDRIDRAGEGDDHIGHGDMGPGTVVRAGSFM